MKAASLLVLAVCAAGLCASARADDEATPTPRPTPQPAIGTKYEYKSDVA